jgi:hypothetical protein
VPTPTPVAAPTTTSLGKWFPPAMRSSPTPAPTAATTAHGQLAGPWRSRAVQAAAVSAVTVLLTWPSRRRGSRSGGG